MECSRARAYAFCKQPKPNSWLYRRKRCEFKRHRRRNPLYLPQAKSYDKSASIGPCIAVFDEPISKNVDILVEILRNEKSVFSGGTKLSQMKRELPELVEYLTRECSFPQGCFLMTGTGTVPPDDFTMISGDVVKISIESIGTLINKVE